MRDGLECVKIIWPTGQENVGTLLNEFYIIHPLLLKFILSAVLSKAEILPMKEVMKQINYNNYQHITLDLNM